MSSGSSSSGSSSSSSSSATSSRLTSCLTEVLLQDLEYATCVMDSGLFSMSTTGGFNTGAAGLAAALVNASTASKTYAQTLLSGSSSGDLEYGTCELLCTATSTFGASDSCCTAASNVQKCESTNDAIADCKELLMDVFALKNECGISGSNIALIVSTCLIICLITAMILLAKWHARQQGKKTLEALEARLSAGVLTQWSAFLAAWNQIANLVWKNLVLRRRKPFALVMEQLLPLLLVTGLVFLANLDTLFETESTKKTNANSEASFPGSNILICTQLEDLDNSDIGALSDTMKTFYSTGQSVIGIFLLIAYIKFVSTNTTTMVIEKETRIREVMKIMGLSDMTLLMSWALTSMLVSTPLAFAIAAELKYGKVFPSSEYADLVFLFWSFSLAIVAFSYFITPFFNKSRTASIASVLIWLILYFPFFKVQAKANSDKYLAALSPPTAFALAVDELLRRAQLGSGFAYTIALLEKPITVPSAYDMSWMLMLDSAILFALGWYLEQVLPQQYGVRKPWNFLFKMEYWKKTDDGEDSDGATPMVQSPVGSQSPRSDFSPVVDGFRVPAFQHQQSDDSMIILKDQMTMQDTVEPVTTLLATQERKGTCLQIKNLRKVFATEDGEKIAVHDLTLTMYSGQITALLGHNGAGKTTTISMLTGLSTPTSGDATLFGRSIKRDFNELRQIMGICPQHDVLFNDLTVEEHLMLFGTMKNVPPQKLMFEVDKMIREVGLVEKRKARAKNLSGGQKRKLSVALAFIGDSKLVFLDEPTSGMDPYSRRFTWNLLQRNRDDRVIVLTTHFMDEADILGDRIAIMADGQLCCAGSSLFLKNRYGAGYNLTVIKSAGCEVEQVSRFLHKFVDDVKCLSNYGSETVFQLPSSAASVFPSLLQSLDHELGNLRIQQYGVSVTTLEEVFLRISRDREESGGGMGGVEGFQPVDQIRKTSATSTQSRPTAARISSVTTEEPSMMTQYSALMVKRLRISMRDRKNWVNAVCIPILFLVILLVLPEINVANFLPDYATTYASTARQGNCTTANFTANPFTRDDQFECNTNTFSYCSLGIVDCDATVCCTQKNIQSPYYPCNTCVPTGTNPCYNPTCMAPGGAKLQLTLNAFLVSLVVMLAFAFVPAAMVAFIVREKNPIQNAKILQLICGANVSAYWLSNWTHDILIILVSVILACVAVPVSTKTLSSYDEVVGVIFLVLSHALAVVPLAYLFSFRFNKHAVAQTSLLVFALSTGGLLSIFSFLCRIVDVDLSPNTSGGLTLSVLDRNYLRWIFMLFPGYSLNSGIYEIATRAIGRDSLFGVVDKTPSSFFGAFEGLGATDCTLCWEENVEGCCKRGVMQLDVAGAPVMYMVIEALIFTLWVFCRDGGSLHWNHERASRRVVPGEDEDVAYERMKVQNTMPTRNDAIFIRNLRQQYDGGKVALDDLCLAIPKGECFGYLGINGAGKSTTMKVLTGQIAPTNGFATLGGYDLSRHRDKARTVLGYCPQFDSLHDLLTVKEQLELYARLKGIPSNQVREAVDQKIQEVGLEEYRNKLTRGLSGGNKRKVSTAIALMGAPRIIFLDEPSTGVDPSSRRKMWDVIASVCAEKESSVVLTTHSMEECEALATRVGILVSGKLKCLGTVGHLKQKFGKGYTVEVKLSDPPAHVVQRLREQVVSIVGSDSTAINSDNIVRLSAALGNDGRGRAILNNEGNAWVMQAVLVASGHIPIDAFCNWWCSEDMSRALMQFFGREFPGNQLVEQQSDHFRFQVPKQSLRPYQIFRLLEESKVRLFVSEYSVSDTSLEHIFNNMAAQQDEERLITNGQYDDLGGGHQGDYQLEPSSLQSVRSFHRSSSLRRSSFLG